MLFLYEKYNELQSFMMEIQNGTGRFIYDGNLSDVVLLESERSCLPLLLVLVLDLMHFLAELSTRLHRSL